MERLNGLMAFVRTADLGSFAAAARVLGISASAVGKAVSRLESQLDVRLLQRSTRSLRLTEEGRLFHERCRRILDDLNDAQDSLLKTRETPRGRVRLSAPIVTHHLLLPVLPKFMTLYPEIELELDFSDRLVDLIDEGIDVAIRSGQLPDSRLMSRTLRPFQMILCAAPAYLAHYGVPACPRDLVDHVGIGFRHPNTGKLNDWKLTMPANQPDIKIRHIVICNNMEALFSATLKGIGIGYMPDFLAAASVHKGRLTPILSDFLDAPGILNLIWPSNRHLSPKVRAVVDFVATHLFASQCTLLQTKADTGQSEKRPG